MRENSVIQITEQRVIEMCGLGGGRHLKLLKRGLKGVYQVLKGIYPDVRLPSLER